MTRQYNLLCNLYFKKKQSLNNNGLLFPIRKLLSLFVVVFSTLLHDGNVTNTLKYETMRLCSMYCRWLVLPVPGRIMEIHYTLTSFVQKGYQNSYSLLLIDFLKPSAKQATNVLLKCLLDSI